MWFKRRITGICPTCNERRQIQPGPKRQYGICEGCKCIVPMPTRSRFNRRALLKSILGPIAAAALTKIESLPGLIRRIRPVRQVAVLQVHVASMATMSATLQVKVIRATPNNSDNPVEKKPA